MCADPGLQRQNRMRNSVYVPELVLNPRTLGHPAPVIFITVKGAQSLLE